MTWNGLSWLVVNGTASKQPLQPNLPEALLIIGQSFAGLALLFQLAVVAEQHQAVAVHVGLPEKGKIHCSAMDSSSF